ncbi:2-amino-4-hydroxy-6-hydroxymethyldihydropteridine diphosphokinase [Helicobacter mustelae]|uniref:2-amino-4-hydroxy-6- hydroxymethyldihydropteridine diphosphokinase n=1 Tax=Helicobacter mustelae TaxID=217 RepID=UPI00215D6062|nr:2-amino-4-hydroxy-6-hydroxymethyldihydropteridine diphosphokinase [Helicobacter mustelae]
MGGNEGDVIATFTKLILWLKNHPNFHFIITSPIYRNPAFGYKNQPDFYNATISLITNLNLNAIYHLVFYLERKFGRARKRRFKNAPRTLDIDILFFGHKVVKYPHLKIPHPAWKQRESVIIPLLLQSLVMQGEKGR